MVVKGKDIGMQQGKITEKLLKELEQSISLTEFFNENSKNFININIDELLKLLIQKSKMPKAKVISGSGINRRYFYDILSGKRRPNRDYVLRILLTIKTSFSDVQWLLQATGYTQLYSRDKRDSVIIYCINHSLGAVQCSEMLKRIGLAGLIQ